MTQLFTTVYAVDGALSYQTHTISQLTPQPITMVFFLTFLDR